MEPPSFPAGGPQILRANPGSDAGVVLPLPSGSPPFQFEWSRAGAKLSERFTSSHNAGGVRLSISAARTGDSGVYTLQASNAAGKDTTRVLVEVSPDEMPTGDDPPTFLRRLQDLTVKVGTRTRFLVEIVSSTECRVTWYRNERRLMEAERIALVRDGNFWCADISAVSVDDAGRWTCTAENIGGRASCSAHLNVLVPKAYKRPEFVEELRALLTEQGTVSLECKVVGVPTPVLRWFKDSREIKAGDVFALTANAEDPTSLGTYTCEAVNCMGRAYSSSKVQVVGRASREGSTRPSSGGVMLEPPPIFTKELEDQFVRICDRLTLSCKIVVPPWPRTVVWYNKEGKVESNDKYHILEDGVGGYFIEIQTSEFPDEGEWKCVATSTGGRVGISTCYVSMDIPKNYRKPRFMENLQAVLTDEGLVSFECKVVGFPTPVLSWFKDGQELKPGDVYQLTGTNSLGSYCCIARNFMGQASSSAELTVEDIQNQLNEEEKLQLFSKNQAPKYLQGLKSVEAKIDEPFRFTIKVAIPPEPTVLWYRDEQPVDESSRCHLGNEDSGSFFLDIQNLEFMDQAEWKCVAMNDYGQSVTSCFLKLVIPRHYKKPRFLENLQAILSDEGAVNLECKVIGVPQPVLKWYKDGEELKPGDIHRIISGQDGTCCLGTYTCEAQNCMGIAASSASLLGFEDSLKAKNKKQTDEQTLQRNLSLSTIHEERTSQMYDTPVGDITLDDKGEISFSFDGKEVSVSLYETPDLTEEEALQIVEMYADQLSENVTEHNVVELPPLRFVKETSTSGNLLMEAIIIDVSPEYFTSPEEDLRTEADIEDISIADENGPPQLSLDQDVSGEDYLEKTMAILSDERADISRKMERKKSDSQKSVDDYFSLSRDRSSSEEKKDDETQVLSESDLQSFASAHSAEKLKSKSSKPSLEDGQESSDVTKTVLLKEDLKSQYPENSKDQRHRRGSRSSRRSTSSEKSPLLIRKENLEKETNKDEQQKSMSENIKMEMMSISSSLTKVMNAIQIIERDIILKSELMSVAATASRSLEIINSLITPLSEIHSITDTITETENDSPQIIGSLFNRLPQSLGMLEQSLTIVEKCIDYESDNKTLVKKTCVSLIEKCGDTLKELITEINTIPYKEYTLINDICISNIKTSSDNIIKTLKCSEDASKKDKILNETMEDKIADINLESKHLHHTQKVLYALKSSLKSVLSIIGGSDVTIKCIPIIKNAEIILDEISTPIQELQNALEQVEILSVAESDSKLPKYNTEIIESVINHVLKLRTAFEQLSTNKENKINDVLLDIIQNIHSISSQLEIFEEKNGKFDILHNDNKLEVLQTMAQILISLENSLPILDTIPYLKTNMSDFHKNLTKVLENVIEGNDSTKYFTLLEICSAVSRINTSLNNMESRQMLSLAIIGNTLKIIQRSVHETIFENNLNKSVLKNINDLLLDIQETINQVEESTLSVESEKVEDLSIKVFENNKVVTVLEHVQKTIASMSNVISFENVENLTIAQVFENIHPILTEIQCCVASLNMSTVEHSENVSDMTVSSFSEAIAHPLCELHQNITVLNEVICEIAKNHEITQFTAFAEPLIELQNTLEILQAEIISQYEEILQCPEILGSIANSVHNLQSCILKIQEHDVLELVDDMSTLDDISGIKTTADILLPSEQFDIISSVATLKIEELPIIHTNVWQPVAAQDLKKIKKNISLIQNSVIAENVKALPDDNLNLPIKSSFLKLELISSDIQSILEPISTEVPQMLSLSTSKLTTLVHPLEQLQESLSLVSLNINIYEDLGDTVQIQVFTENLLNLKADVDKFSNVLQLALAAVDVVIDNATKSFALRQLPEKLDNLLSEYTHSSLDKNLEMELMNLRTDVHALNTNKTDNNKAEEVNEIIGKINKSISKVQDESFNCTAQNLNILSHESNLIKALTEVEQCIATLHQCNFPEESVLLTSETENGLAQIAIYKEVESILHLDQIIKIVNTVYHESNEGSESDIKFTEEFFDTFTKEISLLRYLIKNRPSSKQIIKSIQVFYALLANLNDYKSQYGNTLSDEFNKCLKTYLYDMENCLKEIKTSLIEIIHTQSQLLFDIPKTKIIDDEQFLKNIIQSENNTLFQTTYSVLLNVIELSKPFNDNLKNKIIEELSACKPTISQKDDQDFKNNYDYLCSFLTTQASNSIEDPLQQITEKLLNVIQKYEDVKEIIGVGKQMIFMQCISDCIDILKQYSVDSQLIYNIEKCVPEEISIDELLLEISEPLDCFSSQIINIRNKIILASEKDVDLTELKTLESHTNAVRKINEKVVLCISNNELDNHDAALAVELNNKCHSILNMLITLEDSPIFDSIKELTNPIEEIEKNLKLIISYNQNLIDKKSQSNKEKAEALLQQMEQHIEIIEIVEEVSAVLRLDDLKETASIVRELRGSIAKSESAPEPGVDVFDSVITNQIPLTDKLQKALISLHSQALIGAEQDIVNIKEDKRQQIIDAVSDLQNNLIELTNLPLENKLEIINNAQIDITQEEGIIIDQIKSDKQSTDDVAEQSLNLLKNSDDLQNLVPEELGIQESEIKDSQVEESCDSKYNLTSIERSEEAYASKSVIDILLENIQLYLRQDVTEIAKEVASSLNCEAVTITQEISYQICQNFDLRRLQEETTESLVLSDDQMNILSNLHKNLEIIITYEPARNVAEIIVEDKLLQFKNVAKNLYESIQNLHISTNSTIEDDKTENLAIASPKVIEPEIDGLLSENLVLSDFAEQNSNDANENLIDNEVLLRQKDSKPEDIVTNVNEYSTPNVDSNKKEDFGAGEENLVHYISEYVSEEVMERFKKTLPVLNTEHLEKSYETAKQLHTLCKVTNFDDTNNCNLLKEKLELSIELNESIMIIHNQILEAIKYSQTLYEKDELQKIQSVFKNLVDALETYITSKQYVELEKGIALDKSKPALLKDSIHKTEQTVDIMEKTDEVCKIEELEILSVNKEDDEIFDLKMSESSLIDKSDDSLINNEVIEPEHLMTSIDHEVETNSIQILEKLLKEINDDVDLFIMNVDNSESIQNNLDEVQSLIIKLKCDFDGTANDALNETLEDLECNVRSVQLQINEQSPPVLLKEECSNLQVIVSCLKNIEEVQGTALVPKINIVNNCSEEADQTIQLLNKACCLETNSKLDGIFSCLNNVKDILKSLRIYFAGDTETLIFKGIDVIQKLDQVEDTIFSLEKDIDRINDIDNNIKDNIVTAMHSVYGSISNIRGTITSIQKRYMYEKYGKPSQNFLKSIKNISDISRLNIDNKSSWINCAKFLRKVLNHFEDIKFYINFDRTARIPNDAAFTKIILREIITVLNEVQNLHEIKSGVSETINGLKKYVNDKNLEIEERTTLEVKDKIPIFINLSIKILEATEVIKLQMQGSREDLSVTQLIRIDDKEQDKITDHSTVIGRSIEVQPTHDIIIESAELVSMDEKKKQELVKVTIGEENVFETASKIEISAEFQVCRDHQSNDNEQLSIDKVQVREEKKSIDVDILKISSEGSQQQRDNVVSEKGIELQENTSQCVKDENYKSDKTFTDISNVITSENDTAEKLNLETVKDSQPVSESLINFDNCEVLITNAEVETILKIEENDNFIINEIDASVPENQQSDILKDTLEATTSRELSEQIVPHTTVTKNIQLNEHKGRVNTIENTIHVGLLTNNNLDINDKNSTIEDHNHDQATDFNIEKNLKSQENQILLEKLPVDDIETENNKICEQTQKKYLLNDKEKDGKLQLHKDDTNEINQQFSFSELSAISEENSNNIVIGNESIGKIVEIYANNSTAREEIGSLPEQKNIQYTEIEANKDINKEYDILDLKDLPKKRENIEHQEVPLDKNTECILTPVILQDLEPLNKEKISLINDTATVDTLCVDRLNGETSLGYVLRDTDVSPVNISEESRKDNESNFKEQGVPKELIEKSVIQNEDDSIKTDRKIIIKDSEDSTKRRNTNETTAKEDISKREAVNRIENVASDDSQLLQSTINEIKTEELMTSSITEKIKPDEGIAKYAEETNESILIPVVKEHPSVNVQTDLANKETEDIKYSNDHGKPIDNKSSENNILMTTIEMDINEIKKTEQFDNIESNIKANENMKEKFLITEDKTTVAEIFDKDIENNDQKGISMKKDILNKSDECSIGKEIHEEIIKYSIEKDTDIPDVNLKLDIETKETAESTSENKEATEFKTENEDLINATSHKGDKKAPVKKNEDNESLNTLESKDIQQIKDKEQSDNTETNFPADTSEKKEYSESEQKVMATKILEIDNKKNDHKSITLKDVIIKDDLHPIGTEKPEELVECNQPKSVDQPMSKQTIEKDIQKLEVIVVSDLEDKQKTESKSENKEAIEVKPENINVINTKSHKGSIKKNGEKQPVDILESNDIQEIKEKEKSDNAEANYPADISEKKEYLESEHKVIVAKILDIDNKKDDQESITLKKDLINKDDIQTISKDKQKELVECNQSESADQPMSKQTIEKDIQKLEVIVVSDIEDKQKTESKSENKEATEVKPENIGVTNTKSHTGSIKKNGEKQPVDILESNDIQKIKDKEKSGNAEASFTADIIEKKENPESENKATVAEKVEKDNKKDDQEKSKIKHHKPHVNLESDLENKKTSESKSEDKEATEIKPENKEVIDDTSHKDSQKSPIKKNGETESLNIFEGKNIEKIKEKEKSDYTDANICEDKSRKKQYSESECKTVSTEVLDDKKHDQESVTLLNDIINKDDVLSIDKEKQKESGERNKLEESIEKDKQKPVADAQTGLEKKEVTATKSYSDNICNEKATVKQNKENELVKVIKDTSLDQTGIQAQPDKSEDNFTDKLVKEKHVDSELKDMDTKIIEKSNEKEHQENIVLKDIKDSNDKSAIYKEKQEESLECNQTKSESQVMFNQPRENEKVASRGNKHYDQNNKEADIIEYNLHGKKSSIKKKEENDLVKDVQSPDIHEIKEQSDTNKENFTIDTIVKEEHIESVQKVRGTKTSKKDCKKDQENIILNDSDIDKSSINSESDNKNVYSQSIDKEKLEHHSSLQTDLENKQKKEDSKEIKEQKEQFNKNKEDAELINVNTIENKESIQIIAKNVISEFSEESCKNQENLDAISKDKAIVNYEESLVNIQLDSKTKEIENIDKSIQDSTFTCKQKESDFDTNVVFRESNNNQEISTIENNVQLINETNNVSKEKKSKSLEKYKNQDSLDKKTSEINIKQTEKYERNSKKKQKPKQKKTIEEYKEKNEEKSNIEVKLVMNEKNILFEKPIQLAANDEISNIINIEKRSLSIEESKSRSAENKKYTIDEDIRNNGKDIAYTTIAKDFTNTEQNENQDYLVCQKYNDNTYPKIETEKEKYRPKESPTFIDHNKTDYSLQFPRPPNYTSKSFDNEELISLDLNSLNGVPIYKAQTLMNEYRARSSYSPQVDKIDPSSPNYGERTYARCRSKAVSESRSTTSEKRATRDLKRKPVFSTFLTDRTAVESSRVKLTCSILSSGDPTITWHKNGSLVDDKQKFRSKFTDGLITLEVLNAIPNDSGEYSCTISNEYGSITSSANLKVYPSFEASPIPPTFTRSIRDVYHSLENELVLECRIRGQPLPSITWYKDDKPITLCERYQAHYLADGVCRLTVSSPSKEDSGKYTCHAESSIWSDQIYHNVQFNEKEHCVSPNILTLEKVLLNRQVLESRKPHFTNVISDYKVVSGGTIGLQVEIKGSPSRVEWLREGCSITDTYRNAQTYFDHGIYTLALTDVTEKESGLYTCRAWSSHGNVDMNASIIVVQPNQIDGKPAVIVSRPAKDVHISIGEDINISFRVQGEPKAKVIFMKGLRDITHSQRVCKMTSDDYVKFTLKRSVISDAGTYCILARNAYGCDRAFVTVLIRQRASSENLVSDWTYPMDDLATSGLDRNYKAVPDRIPSEPSVVDGGKNWVSLAWPKPDCQTRAPILAYKVESWLIGKEGGARWVELGITPRNCFDAFNLKQEEEYHFRVTPRNRYGWGESVQTTSPIGIGLSGDRPEFIEILPGQLKVLLGETATLCCTFKGKPTPEILWMKNGHDIEEDTNRVKITLNSFEACLNIENVKIEDEGRYSCEASNIHGRSSTYARMTVITDRSIWEADAKLKRERSSGVEGEYPPQFTMRLRDRRVQATYPVRLTCQVVGSPAPELTWFKNGEKISADGRHSMSQDEYFYTLEIAPTTLDDGGVYEAMARNNSGAISCRCSLVVDKGIRAYVAPEFCCGLEPLYQLREGEELRISAIVEAYPSVGVSWYRDGVRLRPSRRAIMTLDRDGQIELALAFVTARDAGVYTCTASNEVGRVSTSGKVEILGGESTNENVRAPPIFVSDESSSALYSSEPRFLRKPRSSEAREGDTVIIECEVIGDPKPEVYWLRDFLKPDYYRDANHFKRVGAGPEYRFEIPHAKFDYTGAYSVIAKNIHGEAKAIISLQILARDPNSSQDSHNIRYGRVEVIPRFEKELTDLLCYDGDVIEFECRISANPEPDIRWFHYSEVVPDCIDFESSYHRGIARLKIKQVTAEDEGTYRCEASNSLGRATSSACLVVYPPGEPNTLSQRLRRPPVLLSGASTPRSTPRTTPRTTPARSLSATPGPDSRRLCSPSREIAPKFYTYPFNRVAEEGDTVVFQCAVKGLPPPWATWDKDGIIITASSRITIKEKDEMFRILEIEQVNIEDVGLYRITLENDYGRAEASARLEVISGKGKFHGTRSYSASPSRRALTYRRRTPSFSRQD